MPIFAGSARFRQRHSSTAAASSVTRYCRQHSAEFVSYLLAGKQIPNRQDILEADLVSRKQQILFRRIWRLIESRLLPLAGDHIDQVVVERVAFDVLAGPFKARQRLAPEKASEMYWHGPQLGFPTRLAMLKEEFGGRCAYCGAPGAVQQIEHLLPRSAFPFDSYFNVLPACAACNSRKGARTALEAGMVVHPDAYVAYCAYVRGRKVAHVYHSIKKGLLNLLQRPATSGEAERRLGMLANDLVTVAATQRAPRPLARYLACRLAARTGHRPSVSYRAGRHTALYRGALLPQYDKETEKEQGDMRNHAVDAIVLGCDLPAATVLENRNWKLGVGAVRDWFAAVAAAAPETLEGLPRVDPVQFVPYFEEDLGGGYCRIDLSAFNWNRKRKATHQLDPFGQTREGRPLKRVAAAEVLKNLVASVTRAKQTDAIAHRALRQHLQCSPEQSAERLVRWLQQSVQAGLGRSPFSDHPADRARQQLLDRFVQAPVEKIIAGKESVPPTIGIRCLIAGSMNKLGVTRAGRDGNVFQRYQSQPVVRELYVGYRSPDGQLDRSAPVVYVVGQCYEVRRQRGRAPVTDSADSALYGRPHGSREPIKTFLSRWRADFASLCEADGLAKVFRITQGCTGSA